MPIEYDNSKITDNLIEDLIYEKCLNKEVEFENEQGETEFVKQVVISEGHLKYVYLEDDSVSGKWVNPDFLKIRLRDGCKQS
jgi:hypothetical protein